MTSSAPPILPLTNNPRPTGFTLLELIISMTIISMVVLVIYSAFAMGSRVWERQGRDTELQRREEVLVRLLLDDAAGLVPYTTLWEGRETFFMAGGPGTLFYVTRNGFGARRRGDAALFFGCLYLDEDDQGDLGIYLLKMPEPNPDLLRAVRGFSTLSEGAMERYTLPDTLRRDAVLILSGLSEAAFSYAADPFLPFHGPPEDALEPASTLRDEDDLELGEWTEQQLPGQILLRYALEDAEPRAVLLVPGG